MFGFHFAIYGEMLIRVSQKETLVHLSNVVRVRSLNLRFLINEFKVTICKCNTREKEKRPCFVGAKQSQVTLYREFSPLSFSYNLIYFLVPSG